MSSDTFDVIVLGLGAMGSAAAYHLALRGKRVLGLEQYTAAHDRGSSHGESRIIRQAYHENPAYVPLVQRAYELWEQLEADTGQDILKLTGGLMIGSRESAVVQGTIRSAREHGLEYQTLDANELRRRFPTLRPRPDDMAVYEVKAGFLRPEVAVSAHLQQAERHAAELHFLESVERWTADASGDGVDVVTSRGRYRASRLVIAPGAWASRLLAELRIPFAIRRHSMCWFDPGAALEMFSPDRFPIYIWDVNGHEVFYGFPFTGGDGGGVKAAMHSGGDPCAPETLHAGSTDLEVAELRRCVARFIPALNGPVVRSVPCMYTLTPDEHFVLSVHPEFSQVAIAAGFSGHGFKFASVIGEVLADLSSVGSTKYEIGFLNPLRFGRDALACVAGASDQN
ncbi:MAG: N-methyl-L-tryptophan oxidase [Acidobacteriota bacterium]|nr:N-methyl-L-tryptophan oxidase [Acidobacteriota bacterium]